VECLTQINKPISLLAMWCNELTTALDASVTARQPLTDARSARGRIAGPLTHETRFRGREKIKRAFSGGAKVIVIVTGLVTPGDNRGEVRVQR